MNAYAHKANVYQNNGLEGLSQRDLLVRLYQGAERFLLTAQLAIQNKQHQQAHDHCQKAKAIFIELMATLNLAEGGEFAKRLQALYAFFLTRISEANLLKKPELIAEILPIVASLREAWQQIPDTEANTSSLRGGTEVGARLDIEG